VLRPNNTFQENAGYKQHLINILYIIIDIILSTTSGDSCGLPPDLKASTSLSNLPRAVKGEYYEHYNHPLVVNVFTINGLM
jgi:hypothetical protein